MKKINKIIGVLLCLCMLFSMTACTDTSKIETPSGFSLDENNYLRWNVVPGAKNYELSLDGNGESSVKTLKTNGYSLDLLAEGDYVIKVKAKSGGSIQDSNWSENVYFKSYNSTGLIYRLTDNGSAYEIIEVGRAKGDVNIEDKYRNKPVTKIGDGAFKNASGITGMTIGENVTSIGENAFYNCSKLEKVVLPSSLLSLGEAAFQSCVSLKEVSVPENLVEIPKNAFAYCKKIETIDFTKAKNLKYIREAAFARCESVKSLEFNSSLLTIDANAFAYGTSLESVKFGAALESIGEKAFMNATSLKQIIFAENSSLRELGGGVFAFGTSLKEVTLPEGLEKVSSQCFANCSALEKISLPSSIKGIGTNAFANTAAYKKAAENSTDYIFIDNWLIGCVKDYYSNTVKIEKTAFSAYETEKKTKVVGIADSVFAGMPLLEEVDLPVSVVYLGDSAFSNCKALKRFSAKDDAGHSLKVVGNGAFVSCDKLNDVQFDKKGHLESIGSYAFYGCKSLIQKTNTATRGMLIPTTVKKVGTFAFKDTQIWKSASLEDMVYVDNWIVGWSAQLGAQYESIEDMTEAQIEALENEEDKEKMRQSQKAIRDTWNQSPSSITIKEGTLGIADFAFYHLFTQSIIGIDMLVEDTNEPMIIGEGAFYRCEKLEDASLNSKMTALPDHLFYKCKNLTSVTLPRSLVTIGKSVFYNCERLSTVNFTTTPSLKTIGDYAFFGCLNLDSPTFHISGRDGSIETIGDYAFYGCNYKLKVADLPNSLQTLGDYAFANCSALEKIVYGTGIKNIPDYAFYNCASLNEVDIPDTIETVGEGAYLDCSFVVSLTIGNNVKTIGNYAFSGMAVSNVKLPASVVEIGSYAFRNDNSLTSIVVPATLSKLGSHFAFGNEKVTFYLQSSTVPSGWSDKWNSCFRPVVFGCTLDETDSFVVSVTVGENTFLNSLAENGFSAPVRDGYTFVGWSKTEGGSLYLNANEISSAKKGETLIAVWNKI